MPINDLGSDIRYAIDLLAIFAFALSGAFLAVRKDFDFFGTIVLSEAAGLGGGLFRDLVLGVMPVAFTDLGYFFTPVVAAAVVYFGHGLSLDHKVRDNALLSVSDAVALGIFSVTGTIKALDYGVSTPAAAALGMASACGGGALASLVVLEVPSLLRWNRDLYALPALAGAGATATLHVSGLLNMATALGAATFAVCLRLLALRYGWRTPRSQFWREPFAGLRHQAAPAHGPFASEEDTVVSRRPEIDTVTFRLSAQSAPEGRHVTDPRLLLMRPADGGCESGQGQSDDAAETAAT